MDALSKGVSAVVSAAAVGAAAGAAVVTKPLTFASSFFANTNAIAPTTAAALRAGASRIFSYLTVREALQLSSCSMFTSNAIVISSEVIQRYVDASRVARLGPCKIVVSTPLSAGNMRRLFYKLQKSAQLNVTIDAATGHVILDAGSAYPDRASFISAHVVPAVSQRSESGSGSSTTTEDNEPEDAAILKHLEVASYDEYDDFNPRHPNPRDMTKSHRRGDSMFNSDMESVALEALSIGGGLSLSAMAGEALAREGAMLGEGVSPGKPQRKSRVTERLGIISGGGAAAGHSSDEEDDSKPAPRY